MTTIKITYGQETRRVTLAQDETRGLSSYASFVDTVKNMFPQLAAFNVSLIWYDEDGDKITVSSDPEFSEAVRFMGQAADGRKILRFEVLPSTGGATDSPTNSSVEIVIHRGITCDECGMSPIRGIRYKCTVRDDFDLCEACEAKRTQPYPMVKITDPNHAPAALFFAFRDGEEGGRAPWRRGCRRFGHHGPPPPAPVPGVPVGPPGCPPGPGPAGPPGVGPNECPRWKARWDRRGERCGRRLKETVAPFVAAFDKLVKDPQNAGEIDVAKVFNDAVLGLSGAVAAAVGRDDEADKEGAGAAPAPVPATDADLEEQLFQEALQESILLNEVSTAFANLPSESATESSASAAASTASAATRAAPAPVAAPVPLPKPALRFIKDVTFPDSTAVHPGTAFRKVWKVRNDGSHDWPEGVVLTAAGGDVMCDDDVKVTLPVVNASEEAEIGIDLRAPVTSGLYTAYFRAQTKEGQPFGHRLWAAVMVNEVDDDWTSVAAGAASTSPMLLSAAVSAEEESVASQPAAAASPAPAPSLPVEPEPRTQQPAPLEASGISVASNSSSNVQQPLYLLWRKELQILADMGFVDFDVNLPLLQQHLVTPVSLSGDRNATPNAVGIERVIGALL